MYDTTDPNLNAASVPTNAEYASINMTATAGSTVDHEFENTIYGEEYSTPEAPAAMYATPGDKQTYEYLTDLATNGHTRSGN